MASTIKVDNVQNQPGTNIINKCSVTTTIGAGAGDTIKACAATVTLGRCGGTVALASGATQTGFGRTGTVDWITTPKVTGDSPITGVTGKGYFMNTTAGTITINLPAGSAGDIVSLMDYAGTWQTNNVTVSPNGTDKIGGENLNVTLDTEGQSVTFVYVDSTQGWLNTMDSTSNVRAGSFIIATGGTPCAGATCGDYKIHTFTGPGTFCVSQIAAPAVNNVVSYLVVGGAGSGGTGSIGGGGGAGGFREYKNSGDPYTASPLDGNPGGTAITVSASPYSITVGGGGAGGSPGPEDNNGVGGNSGYDSVFSTITAAGGGRGSSSNCGITRGPGEAGGSGGGNNSNITAVNAGNTPPESPAQGTPGGNAPAGSPTGIGASGGGATQPYKCGGNPWAGGCGATTSISAGPVTYAGGGGGGKSAPTGIPACAGSLGGGEGGPGGGGSGSTWPQTTGEAGTINTGGGGGGGGRQGSVESYAGGTGGSGIVIIRYKFQ